MFYIQVSKCVPKTTVDEVSERKTEDKTIQSGVQ